MRHRRTSTAGSSLLVLGTLLSIALTGCASSWTSGLSRDLLRQCSADLLGACTGSLDVGRLFGVRFTIAAPAPDSVTATVGFAGVVERVPVWREGNRIRFHSTSRPIAFDARVPTADAPLDAFIQYASHLVHVQVPRTGAATWSRDWSYLGVPATQVRFDLYVGEESGYVAGGYFFFRDQRLPALYGEGITCDGNAVRLRERNLGFHFEGRFDRAQDELRLTASGLGGTVPITFRRVPDDQVPALRRREPDDPWRSPGGHRA